MSKTIKINGKLLTLLLEKKTGKTLKDLSLEAGFSKNFLAEACRTGKASPTVAAVVKLYGVDIDEAIEKEPEDKPTSGAQLSFDDLYISDREGLKKLFREVFIETISDFYCREIMAEYDHTSGIYTIRMKVRGNDYASEC